jgi:hypothetical protein
MREIEGSEMKKQEEKNLIAFGNYPFLRGSSPQELKKGGRRPVTPCQQQSSNEQKKMITVNSRTKVDEILPIGVKSCRQSSRNLSEIRRQNDPRAKLSPEPKKKEDQKQVLKRA